MVEILTVEKLFQEYCEASYSLNSLPLSQGGLHAGFGAGDADRSTTRNFPRSGLGRGPTSSLQFMLLLTVATAYSFRNIPNSLPFNQVFRLIIPLTSFSLFFKDSLILVSFLGFSLMAQRGQAFFLPFSVLAVSLGPAISQPW